MPWKDTNMSQSDSPSQSPIDRTPPNQPKLDQAGNPVDVVRKDISRDNAASEAVDKLITPNHQGQGAGSGGDRQGRGAGGARTEALSRRHPTASLKRRGSARSNSGMPTRAGAAWL
jgi:hypothetical protein